MILQKNLQDCLEARKMGGQDEGWRKPRKATDDVVEYLVQGEMARRKQEGKEDEMQAVANLLAEIKGQFWSLSTHKVGSVCIEKLIDEVAKWEAEGREGEDTLVDQEMVPVIREIWRSLRPYMKFCAINRYASHVMQHLAILIRIIGWRTFPEEVDSHANMLGQSKSIEDTVFAEGEKSRHPANDEIFLERVSNDVMTGLINDDDFLQIIQVCHNLDMLCKHHCNLGRKRKPHN